MTDRQEFEELLASRHPEIESRVRDLIGSFYDLVIAENKVQNLTRLVSPSDFYRGHFLDCVEFLKLKGLGYPCVDLGSGLGVPGLLVAILSIGSPPGRWVLAESELKKADFLKMVVDRLGLTRDAEVFYGRGEDFLSKRGIATEKLFTVVSRAVGKVTKIYTWIRNNSTWNELVLFKGPGWESEWTEFQATRFGKELSIRACHEYSVGTEGIIRKIIIIQRAKR